MEFLKDQRAVIGLGIGAAVLAGVIIAAVAGGGPRKAEPERKDLQIDMQAEPTADAARKLRCFVDGQFVGEATLAECAERNGVAAQSLDVGLDESGALVAAQTASLAPPPASPPGDLMGGASTPDGAAAGEDLAGGPQGQCLRFQSDQWRVLSESVSLNTCVQMLFSGQCERPGGASYGRWGEMTLRLVPRRVEQSFDNRQFRKLVDQDRNCEIPPIR